MKGARPVYITKAAQDTAVTHSVTISQTATGQITFSVQASGVDVKHARERAQREFMALRGWAEPMQPEPKEKKVKESAAGTPAFIQS